MVTETQRAQALVPVTSQLSMGYFTVHLEVETLDDCKLLCASAADCALFRALAGDGTGQVCRGSGPGDNLAEYYLLRQSIPSLEECKAECLAVAEDCRGIEYHSVAARCEVWIRAEGVESTAEAEGYTCLVYAPNLPPPTTTSTVDPALFQPVSGDGSNQACRGGSATDNLSSYFTVVSGLSIEQCKAECVQTSSCKGIEYHSSGRCEIWIRPEGIETTLPESNDYTCLRYVA
ncbi:unnamed protein product [Effrenium voratum]|nr:unnamed protein product [Effrenium voratum]